MPIIHAVSNDPFATENNPVVRWLWVFLSIGGFIVAVRGLRNARLWWLLLTGTKGRATVEAVEILGTTTGTPLRRPLVSFTTEDGRVVRSAPVVYRKRCKTSEGSVVKVSYAASDPARVTVSGFDLQLAEPLSVALGALAMTLGIVFGLTM